MEFDWQAWFTAGVAIIVVIALIREVARPDLILLGGLALLLLTGILTPEQAFAGFANPAMLTVAALFVVANGVERTGALRFLDYALTSGSAGVPRIITRMMSSTALLSAFLNNTAVVAMLTPRIQSWGKKNGVPPSKLLIPLSYAAILGGMTTLIGTSTNIIVSGLLEAGGHHGLGMFDLTWIGIPAVILVVIYFIILGHRLLPDHSREEQQFKDGLENCLFEVRVASGSPFIGRSIADSGLRALGDAYLAHIRRHGELIPVTPREILRRGDVLVFVGSAASLDRLLQMPGLERTIAAVADNDRMTLPLYEAVVAPTSKLVGRTLREASFRENYQGVVLGIQRKDEQITESLGRIPIKAGDLLLVEAWNGFDKRWNENREEFYLVAPRRLQQEKVLTAKAPVALAILLAMIVAFSTGIVPLVTSALAAALAMIVTRCLRGREAREAIDVPLLVVIASAFGVAAALEKTGVAAAIAYSISSHADAFGPLGVLAAIYITTNLLTEFLTNNAAAILMVPIALAAAADIGVDATPFAVAVAVAASSCFMIPIGYQTNLMVMAAGGYRFSDYIRVGFPVSLLVFITTMTMIYLVWF